MPSNTTFSSQNPSGQPGIRQAQWGQPDGSGHRGTMPWARPWHSSDWRGRSAATIAPDGQNPRGGKQGKGWRRTTRSPDLSVQRMDASIDLMATTTKRSFPSLRPVRRRKGNLSDRDL
ncbi:MAG: hypothetical protein VKJ64_14275, partial [Leptolyngbyaceae bacterium]|nr:hypothetical protein [Leptolyngbyaceae bacterium]